MVAYRETMKDAKPVAFASQTTHGDEWRYPQLELKVIGLDFELKRFRNYLVGSPLDNILVSDHKPLWAVFNGSHVDSILAEKDIDKTLEYKI